MQSAWMVGELCVDVSKECEGSPGIATDKIASPPYGLGWLVRVAKERSSLKDIGIVGRWDCRD